MNDIRYYTEKAGNPTFAFTRRQVPYTLGEKGL